MSLLPRTDLHIHAKEHGQAVPPPEMAPEAVAQKCRGLGIAHVGILDHFPPEQDPELATFRRIIAQIRAVASSEVRVYAGAEVNVLDLDGGVTIARTLREELDLDYCVAAIHAFAKHVATEAERVPRYHAGLMAVVTKCDWVDAIAHPWHEPLKWWGDAWRFARVPEAYRRELVGALAEHGKAMEVSGSRHRSYFAEPEFRAFLCDVRDAGVRVLVGSDAHVIGAVGDVDLAFALLEELGFPAAQIWTPEVRR